MVARPAPTAAQAPPGITLGKTADPSALAKEASNPAAPLTQVQIRDILLPSVPGTDGATNLLQIQPVIPIGPFRRAAALDPARQSLGSCLPLPPASPRKQRGASEGPSGRPMSC